MGSIRIYWVFFRREGIYKQSSYRMQGDIRKNDDLILSSDALNSFGLNTDVAKDDFLFFICFAREHYWIRKFSTILFIAGVYMNYLISVHPVLKEIYISIQINVNGRAIKYSARTIWWNLITVGQWRSIFRANLEVGKILSLHNPVCGKC